MNSRPMILRLPSGLVTPDSASQEAVRDVDGDQVGAGGGDEVALHLGALPGPQQPVVDEHTRQPVADGALHQRRGHRGVHAARTARRWPGRRRSGCAPARPARRRCWPASTSRRSRRTRAGTGSAPAGRAANAAPRGDTAHRPAGGPDPRTPPPGRRRWRPPPRTRPARR